MIADLFNALLSVAAFALAALALLAVAVWCANSVPPVLLAACGFVAAGVFAARLAAR